jgi:hypothetical protein
MAQAGTRLARSSNPVSVDIGVSPARRGEGPPPDICVVGIAGEDDPWLSQLYPRALVRDTRFRDEGASVEHVRLQARDAVEHLPGLRLGRPSRVRDAVRVALNAGARAVDVVLVREKGLMPWDLDKSEVLFALDPFLSPMVGTVVVFPDMGGPVSLGPGTAADMDDRVDRFVRATKLHATRWAERYQVALLDDPGVGGELGHRVLQGSASTDAALCRWVGDPLNLRAHGWRSAAAFVGGVLAARPNDILSGVAGFRAPLPAPRAVFAGRHAELALNEAWRARLPEDDYYVDVVPDMLTGMGSIRTEPSLRAPVGMWSLPALRVAKVIHWRIMQTASRFVFEAADVGKSIALSMAVTRALEPYAQAGVLTGPEGEGAPDIRGGVVRNPAAPGLRVEIAATLLPWTHKVNVRVNLRPGSEPVFEEFA